MNKKLIYPGLSYQIIGAAFKVFNKLGWGHKEIYYHRALLAELRELGLKVESGKRFDLVYNSKIIGKYFLDFIVNDKIIIELKVKPVLGYIHINQVVSYLKQTKKKLAILIYFTKEGVRYRRIINTTI